MSNPELDQLCVNTIRTLAIDGVQKANAGHPGMPMGMADVAYVLWTQFLRHNPGNPDWFNRDRFVLSAGHGSMLLYALLHLTGYDLPLEELKSFRQWDSKTPGHPEYGLTAGVETTTGPLGQGFANGVGMAIAEAFLAATFNRPGHEIVNHYVYAIVSDGDLMEGVSHEAASLAGHMKLGKIIYLYDDNHISIDGSTDLAFTEDRMKRFEAYGWHTQQIDGHDRAAVAAAIKSAQVVSDKPSIIACRTIIGYGSPNKANTAGVHGAPLGVEEVRLTKEAYGWDPDKEFYIPDDVLAQFRKAVDNGGKLQAAWQSQVDAYAQAHPSEFEQFRRAISGELPTGWEKALPTFSTEKPVATRQASGQTLNAIAPVIPTLIGGSADLAPSNNTYLKGYPVFANDTFAGRNFHFGVREHGMVAILNGMALHGGVIPYGGTFLVFSDYCRPAIRLAAMLHIPSIFVFTHDSVGLGEDGPTHQPVEHIAALRAIPNLLVIRPADANETTQAWKIALEHRDGPVALLLSRQGLPVFDRAKMADAAGLAKGAYVLVDTDRVYPDVILIGTGSEVQFAVEAHYKLAEQGIGARVVSMPCWELFKQQSEDYQNSVLPSSVKARVAIEAGVSMGWGQWIGPQGIMIGLNRFGASAPYKVIYQQWGFTADNVVLRALEAIDKSKR
ncbi:MAG: transketolase [Anaerolineae bacterium]|nr:transketolase [Anaerolineae bacterium]